ncbi:MAG: hypothetical protein ACUVQ8_07055 [Nitrososphaeria archaeon]
MEKNSLWDKYCSFFGQDLEAQMAYNEEALRRHFEAWNRTKASKMVCGNNEPRKIEDVPITDYGDYPVMRKFGQEIEKNELAQPRRDDESLYDYYLRLLRRMSENIREYLPDEPQICVKTTGTTGANKWAVQGQRFNEAVISDTTAIVLMACSREWGDNIFDKKLNALNLAAPVPYLTGWTLRYWDKLVNFIPPLSVSDNTTDMGKKFQLALKSIEKGNKIYLAGGSGALLYMACKYFSDPRYFLQEAAKMTSSRTKKGLISLKLMLMKLESQKPSNLQDIMPLKGLIIGSTDARIYAEFFSKEFGVEPLNAYAASEIGCAMFGRPDRKLDFFPNLRSAYLEFLDDSGEIKKVDEVSKGKVYELIATPFYSTFIRYKINDLFRVTDFYDRTPLFTFEGRSQHVLDVYNYYRFSEDLIAKVMVNAGFKASDRWVVTKSLKPKEKLEVFFEKEWPVKEREAERLIFNSALSLIPGFENYVRDFRIRDPSEAIKVEFLERGAFTRYAMMQARRNVPLGQYKPPKVVPPDEYHIIEELRECSSK